MRYKQILLICLIICILIIISSCSNFPASGNKEASSTNQQEQTTERQNSDIVYWPSQGNANMNLDITVAYPAILDIEPDLENVDYSKLSFCTDILTCSDDLQLSLDDLSNLKNARKMKELVEANKSEWKQVASYDEGLELLKGIIANSKNTDCAIMLIIDYTTFPGIYAVDTRYKVNFELEWNGGEKQCIWFYSKDWIEGGFTPSPEKLLEAFERYTRYSTVTSVVISAVPIPAEN